MTPAEPSLHRGLSSSQDGARHHEGARLAGRQDRILMTVDAVGGVWRYAMELARALRPLGVETVFAGMGPRPTPEQQEEASAIGELVWTDQPLDWMVKDERSLDGIAGALERLADAHDIDLLHLNLPSQACGLDMARPILVVSHSCVVTWWMTMRGSDLPAEWAWQRRRNGEGLARADAVAAPSASHSGLLQRCYGPLARLSTVHNAIGGGFHGLTKEDFALAAGRWWDEGKNAAVLDAAAAGTSWPVRMAGATAGPDEQEVALRHAQALGQLPHEKLLDAVRRAGIVVSPSLYEPFGLAALEGARAGAALVLADIPTYRELWAEAALFFDPRDHVSLAGAINRVADDRELRADLGARALARSRLYSTDRQAGAMAGIYRTLLSEAAAPQARRA